MNMFSVLKWLLLGSLAVATSACTTMRSPSPADPLEGFNRTVSAFNEVVDKVALKPLAKGYNVIAPTEIQGCIGNFFSNLDEIATAVNNLLQGKPKAAGSDVCRFAINTTVGILGLVDVASELGFQKNNEDFGQTLGVWGVGSGPYLVLPLLGPSTIRDVSGRFADSPLDPIQNHDEIPERNSLLFTKVVDKRAKLLPATDLIDRIALDKYAFIRDAYLARRKSLIRDGDPDSSEKLESLDEESSLDAAVPSSANLAEAPILHEQTQPKAVPGPDFGNPADLQRSARAVSQLGLGVVN